MTQPQRDVIAILMQDHREVEGMFAELESLRGATGEADRARRKDLADQVTIELVRHSVAEEAEVYYDDHRASAVPQQQLLDDQSCFDGLS